MKIKSFLTNEEKISHRFTHGLKIYIYGWMQNFQQFFWKMFLKVERIRIDGPLFPESLI